MDGLTRSQFYFDLLNLSKFVSNRYAQQKESKMRLLISTAALLTATIAAASGPGECHPNGPLYLPRGALTYDVFEMVIEHVDLEGCPAEFDPEAVFCRMTLANDLAHVMVFSYDGDQPLIAVKSYELTDGFLPF